MGCKLGLLANQPGWCSRTCIIQCKLHPTPPISFGGDDGGGVGERGGLAIRPPQPRGGNGTSDREPTKPVV